jgi:hypothetical protein
MNWEAIAATGQMLGSIAVVVTLGYLSVQVRHARTDLRRSLSQGRSEAIRGLLLTRATDERLMRINTQADNAFGSERPLFAAELAQRAGLTADEASAILCEQGAFWNYRLQVIPYAQELSGSDRAAFDAATRIAYGQPGVSRFFYETFAKPSAHPDAIRYIEDLLARPA